MSSHFLEREIFEEGNTRTIAVFTELYLRSLGIAVDNTPFAENAEYFRDALVLANTNNPNFRTTAPLDAFFNALVSQGEFTKFQSLGD